VLVQYTLFGVEDKVAKAIERLKTYEPPEGYYVAFSGGKDSTVRARSMAFCTTTKART
jgi:phosphoadenosine phosphosulfate reductase